MPDNDIPIPERIGGIPCERCKHMIISDTAYNFLKSYSYGYITDEEATAVIMEEARRARLHYECAEILVKNALNAFKPKEKRKLSDLLLRNKQIHQGNN